MTLNWKLVGVEKQTITVPAGKLCYGTSTETNCVYKDYEGGTFVALNEFFGSDPAPKVAKSVWFAEVIAAPAPIPEPAPAPRDPMKYTYTGPVPAAPPATSTDSLAWNNYFRAQDLIRAEAALAVEVAKIASYEKLRLAYGELIKTFVAQPQIIQRGPVNFEDYVISVMATMPRNTGEATEAYVQRIMAEAKLMFDNVKAIGA